MDSQNRWVPLPNFPRVPLIGHPRNEQKVNGQNGQIGFGLERLARNTALGERV